MLLEQKVRKIGILLRYGKRIVLPNKIVMGNVRIRISEHGKIKIGEGFSCRDFIVLNANEGEINIGENVFINDGTKINAKTRIVIGDGVLIGQNVCIYDHDHDYRKGAEDMRDNFIMEEVSIGQNCWIGSNTIILKGCKIGCNCVIGAGSVIKEDIPDNTLMYEKHEKIKKQIVKL